jgi:hypothetical protein
MVRSNEPAPRAHAGTEEGVSAPAAGATGSHEDMARLCVSGRHRDRTLLSKMAGPDHRGASRIVLGRGLAEPPLPANDAGYRGNVLGIYEN